MGSVDYIGHEPYVMPIAQTAKAYGQGETIVLSFSVAYQGSPVRVEIPILRSHALDFAHAVARAFASN